MLCKKNLVIALRMFTGCGTMATMLKLTLCLSGLLMLLVVGCVTNQTSLPSVTENPMGNAWAITLPKGSQLVVSDPKVSSQLSALAINEISSGSLLEDCVLVSKSYLIQRDERELALMQRLAELEVRK